MTAASLIRTGLLALYLTVPYGGAAGQAGDASSDLAQSRRGEADKSGEKGPLVHVGAGTTSASTTGYSGKASDKQVSMGRNLDVPPAPSSSLCDGYKGTASHQGCLQIVLPEQGKSR